MSTRSYDQCMHDAWSQSGGQEMSTDYYSEPPAPPKETREQYNARQNGYTRKRRAALKLQKLTRSTTR